MQIGKRIDESASNCDRQATATLILQTPCQNSNCLLFQLLMNYELREILKFPNADVGVRKQVTVDVSNKLT